MCFEGVFFWLVCVRAIIALIFIVQLEDVRKQTALAVPLTKLVQYDESCLPRGSAVYTSAQREFQSPF